MGVWPTVFKEELKKKKRNGPLAVPLLRQQVKYLLETIESYGPDARIIVFSQFLEHLYLVEESIAGRDVSFKGLYTTGKGQLSSKLRQEAIDDFR